MCYLNGISSSRGHIDSLSDSFTTCPPPWYGPKGRKISERERERETVNVDATCNAALSISAAAPIMWEQLHNSRTWDMKDWYPAKHSFVGFNHFTLKWEVLTSQANSMWCNLFQKSMNVDFTVFSNASFVLYVLYVLCDLELKVLVSSNYFVLW